MKIEIWAVLVLSSLLGAIGNLCMKFGTNKVGNLTLERILDPSFLSKFVLIPVVILAILLAFLGRVLMFIPISYYKVGLVTAVGIILWAIFTVIGGILIFGERYNLKVWLGLLLAFISIILLSEGLGS